MREKAEVRVLLPRLSIGFGGELGSLASLARSSTLFGGRIMIPSLLLIIYLEERLLLILSAKYVIKKKNSHLMLFRSALWLGIPRLYCRVVCKNCRIKEKIFQDLCYGFFRIFLRKKWKIGRQHRGQFGQLKTVTSLKIIKKAPSISGRKLYFYSESIVKQILPTDLHKLMFSVYLYGSSFLLLLVFFTSVMCSYHILFL
jgi:hypothetical protein